MRIFFLCLIFIWYSASWAFYVDEASLSAYMLDQKEPLYYSQGVIPEGRPSSLCGPTSVMNWLQLRHQNAYSRQQLVQFVNVIGQDLRQQKIEINNGLTELQLLEFLRIYNDYLGESSQFVLRNSQNLDVLALFSDKPQILLLRYREPVRFQPGGPRRDDFKVPASGAHFVLKVGGDIALSQILVIDPENPGRLTRLSIEALSDGGSLALRVKPVTRDDLNTFSWGVPLVWTLSSLLEEQP